MVTFWSNLMPTPTTNCLSLVSIYSMLKAVKNLKITYISFLLPIYNFTNRSSKVETEVPLRMDGNRLYRYSKVLEGHLGDSQAKALPQCPKLIWAQPSPLNVSAPTNLYQTQKLLGLMEEVALPPFNVDNIIKGIV